MNIVLKLLKGDFLAGYKTYIALFAPVLILTLNWATGTDVTGLGAPVLGGGALAGSWWAVISGAFLRKGVSSVSSGASGAKPGSGA